MQLNLTKNKLMAKWVLIMCIISAMAMSFLFLYRLIGVHTYSVRVIGYATEINAIVFLAAYLSLKRLETLDVWKFFTYLGVLTCFHSSYHLLMDSNRVGGFILRHNLESPLWFLFWIFPLVITMVLNFGFLKYLFKINTRSAIALSILMAMTIEQINRMLYYF